MNSDHRPLPRPPNDHFDGKHFTNLNGAPAGGTLRGFLRWKLFGSAVTPWPKHVSGDTVRPTLPQNVPVGRVAATFVGHCTFLLQLAGGLNVLVDPIWSERASPVTFAGPRRVRPPALAFDDLPPIHLVLVSHGHYDHLDVATLRRLERRFAPLFISGLGNRAFLQSKGLGRVVELDWWERHIVEQSFGGQTWTVTFTPAHHWSNRSVTQRNTTLWGGFWLQPAFGDGPQVYFAGDSAWGREFVEIRERLGAPDLAFLPIGAYEPRWFFAVQHMDPEEAVRAHLALESKQSVAMHFGTFPLTDEGIDEPGRRLRQSLRTQVGEPNRFCLPKFGETVWG